MTLQDFFKLPCNADLESYLEVWDEGQSAWVPIDLSSNARTVTVDSPEYEAAIARAFEYWRNKLAFVPPQP